MQTGFDRMRTQLNFKRSKNMNGLKAKGLLAYGFVLLILTISIVAANTEDTGKTLNIAIGSEPDDLDPIANTGHGDFYDVIKVFSGLLKSNGNLDMAPDLAESWEASPDGKTYIFHLRKDVKWHDGIAFTAEDVKYTYDLLQSGDWISIFPASSEYNVIDDISILDEYTIKFSLSEGVISFRERFALPILPKHLLSGQDLLKTEFWQKPVGTGPYKFKGWERGEDLVFVANNDYYNGPPQITTLRYVIVPDENARIDLLKRGEVDAIKIAPRAKSLVEGIPGITVFSTPSCEWYSLNLPNNKWPFNIKKVRQAIGYAINKPAILKAVFYGEGEVAYGPYRSESWAYNPEIIYNYSPKKSKQLLAEAGFKDTNGDGVLEKDGKKFEFSLRYGKSAELKDIAIAIKTDLADIGIAVDPFCKGVMEITPEEMRVNAFINGWGSPFDPDDLNYQIFSSEFINQSWWNPAVYSNPEVDKLLEDGRKTSDKETRKEIYGKFQKIIIEDMPMVFLVFDNYIYAIRDNITGIMPRNGPHGAGTSGGVTGEVWWNVEQWKINK